MNSSEKWSDPFQDEPLDIHWVAQAIQQAWMMATRKAEGRARREFEEELRLGNAHPHFGFRVAYREAEELGAKVQEIVRTYDEYRTRHIALLRAQLIDCINCTPRPIVMEAPRRES